MGCQVFTTMAVTEIGTGGVLTVVGMLVVFATLSVLGVVIALLSRWLKAAPQSAAQGVDPRIIAVLTAAATAAVAGPVRLTQIKLVDNQAKDDRP